jgi:nitroreductase
MEFEELIKHRYSVRAYQDRPVEKELLERVLEAARLAPTAANRQPFQLVVVHTRGREQELKPIHHRQWFLQAPLLIFACGIPAQAWQHNNGKSYLDVDIAIVMDHLTLAAANLGLGTCWMASFDFQEVRRILEVPDEVEPLVMTPLGYPADQPQIKERKPLSELVRYERDWC